MLPSCKKYKIEKNVYFTQGFLYLHTFFVGELFSFFWVIIPWGFCNTQWAPEFNMVVVQPWANPTNQPSFDLFSFF